ncbi:DUF1492 domain-containing protein [Acidaminococcus intestini]|uniref:DUF1492 domain-containing protein n=2 Tax=Acidaminococcus intestini TaxID=187327 RepID=UPI00307A9950
MKQEMTGRALLEEVKHARQHLNVLKDELREQRSMLDGIRAIVYDGIHVSGGVSRDVADGIDALERKKLEICNEWVRLVNKRAQVQALIARMTKQEHKDLLIERYINCKRWEDVSRAMNYDQRWLFRLHEKAIKEFEKICNENTP